MDLSSRLATVDRDDMEVVMLRERARPKNDFGNAIAMDTARLVALSPPARIYRPRIAEAPATAPAAPRDIIQPLRLFRGHYHRLVALGMVEAATVALSMCAALALRFGTLQLDTIVAYVGAPAPRFALFVVMTLLALGSMGLYQLRQRVPFSGVIARIIAAVTIAEVGMMFVFYAVPSLYIGRGLMFLSGVIAIGGLTLARIGFVCLVDDDTFKRRVLVWGCGERAASIAAKMRRRSDQRGFRIVGYVQPAGEACVVDSAMRIETVHELVACLKAGQVEEIVVAMDDRRRGFPTELLRDCRMRNVRVRDVVTFIEEENGHVNVELARPSWLIFSEGFNSTLLRAAAKRAFDVTVALAVLVLTLPITVATAIAIFLEDRGPIFYKQVRVGRHGAPFPMFKFRSMGVNAERNGAVWAQRDDPRVTRVGAFIRRSRIDEIPQALNVLMGHMSFVGPRPERPAFVEGLARAIPFYMERHFVKPGITGWAQVRFPYGSTEADAREKLGFDLYYVKHHNVLFDLVVLLRTVEIVLFRVGSR